jgi:outer membrane protein
MKKIKFRTLPMVAAASIALFCGSTALADDVPKNSLRLGSYSVFYHVSADNISGPYVPPGVNLQAEDLTTLYGAYIRRLSSKFDVELALGYPPLAKIKGLGPTTVGSVPYNNVEVSSARWIAPTLLLEYRFLSENCAWQPFIGVGVNYTTFYDRTTTAAGNAAFGGPTRLSLTASVGPAATIGVGYHVSGPWHVYGSYSVSQVKSDLTANTAGVERTTHISFGPQALILSVGYSF